QFWGPYLASRGYVLFAISYRLAKKGQKMFPQAVTDVLAAVQFVRGSARENKIEPGRIGLVRGTPGGPRLLPAAARGGKRGFQKCISQRCPRRRQQQGEGADRRLWRL